MTEAVDDQKREAGKQLPVFRVSAENPIFIGNPHQIAIKDGKLEVMTLAPSREENEWCGIGICPSQITRADTPTDQITYILHPRARNHGEVLADWVLEMVARQRGHFSSSPQEIINIRKEMEETFPVDQRVILPDQLPVRPEIIESPTPFLWKIHDLELPFATRIVFDIWTGRVKIDLYFPNKIFFNQAMQPSLKETADSLNRAVLDTFKADCHFPRRLGGFGVTSSKIWTY